MTPLSWSLAMTQDTLWGLVNRNPTPPSSQQKHPNSDWTEHLPTALLILQARINCGTGFSPSALAFGTPDGFTGVEKRKPWSTVPEKPSYNYPITNPMVRQGLQHRIGVINCHDIVISKSCILTTWADRADLCRQKEPLMASLGELVQKLIRVEYSAQENSLIRPEKEMQLGIGPTKTTINAARTNTSVYQLILIRFGRFYAQMEATKQEL
ncbi:hypothetical protein DSO57_1015178 [Entomophthora muscae]|uniref:Uncharacterized protein n=1 Tax=Entomophthora muscae TaxID=34485 RepID=A0ACC2RJT2_9FUNG|nr:hypothetical protein DSO57_1015178 [Entomophthora muscae]